MDDSAKLERARNVALQCIGRNVVNFQKMEAMLKFLIANHKIQGLPDELLRIKRQNHRNVERQTMGSLVDKLFHSVITNGISAEEDQDAAAAEMALTFSVELEEAAHSETREAFGLLVRERNALIHKMLVTFDPNSVQSCLAISRALDKQRELLKPHFEYVKNIVKAVLEGHNHFRDLIESGSFEEMLTGPEQGAKN